MPEGLWVAALEALLWVAALEAPPRVAALKAHIAEDLKTRWGGTSRDILGTFDTIQASWCVVEEQT